MLLQLAFFAATLLAQSSQQVQQPADNDVELREATHRLAIEPPDVAREYEHLASDPFESRIHVFRALSSSMKSAVFVHHLLSAVTTHPEFTAEQRSAIYDAIRLLSPKLYEIDSAAARQDVNDLTLRVQRLFPRDVALALFVEIGSAIPSIAARPEDGALNREDTSGSATKGDQRALRKGDQTAHRPTIKPMDWQCDCSVFSDWCAIRRGANWSCHATGCAPVYSSCGTLLTFDCTGLCVYEEPPPPE